MLIYQNGISILYRYGILVSSDMGKIRLKELREKKGITQVRLAIELGTNQNNISRYESGEREADYDTLIKIADFFNVSIDYLLYRTDKK